MMGRDGRPLFLLDIAVPRDVDPAVRRVQGVLLADIDDLDAVTEANLQRRESEARRVEAIVSEEVDRFTDWWDSLSIVPTIKRLRRQAEALRRREVAKALRRLGGLISNRRPVSSYVDSDNAITRGYLYGKSVFDRRQLTNPPRGFPTLNRPRMVAYMFKEVQ